MTDQPGQRKIKGIRRVAALPVASAKLGMAGIADLVEFRSTDMGEIPYPVEFKRGKAKLHRADEVQLCAQALCLEDMTRQVVAEGALFYAQTKRRVVVPFDAELRDLTLLTITQLKAIFASRLTPPPTPHTQRCRACSLYDLCRPKDVAKPAKAWRKRMADVVLETEEFSA